MTPLSKGQRAAFCLLFWLLIGAVVLWMRVRRWQRDSKRDLPVWSGWRSVPEAAVLIVLWPVLVVF